MTLSLTMITVFVNWCELQSFIRFWNRFTLTSLGCSLHVCAVTGPVGVSKYTGSEHHVQNRKFPE